MTYIASGMAAIALYLSPVTWIDRAADFFEQTAAPEAQYRPVKGAVGATAQVLHVPKDYSTIQAAVDAALPGEKIIVAPGEYAGATITKPIELSGAGEHTKITSGSPTFANAGFYVQLNQQGPSDSGVKITHFTFESQAGSTPSGMFAGVVVRALNYLGGQRSFHVEVARNVFRSGFYGVYLLNCAHCAVTLNEIVDVLTPVMLWGVLANGESSENTITFNTIRSSVETANTGYARCAGIWLNAIEAGSVSKTLIAHNRIVRTGGTPANPAYAISFTASAGSAVQDNQIQLNDFRGSDNAVGASPLSLLALNEIGFNLGDGSHR